MQRTYEWKICQHKKNAFASFKMTKIFLIQELTHQIWLVFRVSRLFVKLMLELLTCLF